MPTPTSSLSRNSKQSRDGTGRDGTVRDGTGRRRPVRRARARCDHMKRTIQSHTRDPSKTSRPNLRPPRRRTRPESKRARAPRRSPTVNRLATRARALVQTILPTPKRLLEHERIATHARRSQSRTAAPSPRARRQTFIGALFDRPPVRPRRESTKARTRAPLRRFARAQTLGHVLDVKLGERRGGAREDERDDRGRHRARDR